MIVFVVYIFLVCYDAVIDIIAGGGCVSGVGVDVAVGGVIGVVGVDVVVVGSDVVAAVVVI